MRHHDTGVNRFHPVVGDLTLSFETMTLTGDSVLTTFADTAEAGSKSEEALNLLASWAETLDPAELANVTDGARSTTPPSRSARDRPARPVCTILPTSGNQRADHQEHHRDRAGAERLTIWVTEGIGLAQRRGGPIEVIRPGDRVFFEPGEDD